MFKELNKGDSFIYILTFILTQIVRQNVLIVMVL